MIDLMHLVAQAVALGGGDLCAAGHDWQSIGGRSCPKGDPLSSQAAQPDAQRYRWLCEDHQDLAARTRRNQILDRMAVMSYSSASTAIDDAMAARG
jgi:hypothetical protein